MAENNEKLAVLRSEHLVKKYGKRTVVNDVSIEVRQGEIVGLLGPNGAGKTTTFYMTTGLVLPNSGKIFLNDLNISNMPMYRRAKLGIGYLPQEASVFRKMTVEDNIRSVLEMTNFTKEYQKEKLEQKFSKMVNLNYVIAPEIIGGLVIEYNGKIIDLSVNTKFESLKKGQIFDVENEISRRNISLSIIFRYSLQ